MAERKLVLDLKRFCAEQRAEVRALRRSSGLAVVVFGGITVFYAWPYIDARQRELDADADNTRAVAQLEAKKAEDTELAGLRGDLEQHRKSLARQAEQASEAVKAAVVAMRASFEALRTPAESQPLFVQEPLGFAAPQQARSTFEDLGLTAAEIEIMAAPQLDATKLRKLELRLINAAMLRESARLKTFAQERGTALAAKADGVAAIHSDTSLKAVLARLRSPDVSKFFVPLRSTPSAQDKDEHMADVAEAFMRPGSDLAARVATLLVDIDAATTSLAIRQQHLLADLHELRSVREARGAALAEASKRVESIASPLGLLPSDPRQLLVILPLLAAAMTLFLVLTCFRLTGQRRRLARHAGPISSDDALLLLGSEPARLLRLPLLFLATIIVILVSNAWRLPESRSLAASSAALILLLAAGWLHTRKP